MIRMKHPSTGLMVEAPTGFSWTTFFFGGFVPLFRGMYAYCGIWILASVFTLGLASFVVPFLINKHYVKFLIEKGYKPSSQDDTSAVLNLEIGYSVNVPEFKEAA